MHDKIIIAFLARAGSGKSTAAAFVEKHWGPVERVSFAGPLKEMAKELYGFSDDQVYGSLKETPDARLDQINGPHPFSEAVTPRQMLQRLGNTARNIIGPRVWVDAALNTISESPHRIAVIDDCRYINEAKAIAGLPGGYVIKLEAPDRESNADPNHPSEAEVDKVPLRYVQSVIRNEQALGLDAFHTALRRALEGILG